MTERETREKAAEIAVCNIDMEAITADIDRSDRGAVARRLDEIARNAAYASAFLSWMAVNSDDPDGAERFAKARDNAVRKALG